MRQGRPVWIMGMLIAVISENMVRTSAALVAGRRHSALASRKMADSITPAWLMPIQNTKLVMKKPHTTGRFRLVMPRPRLIMMPMVMAAARTTKPSIPTTGQNQRGVSSMDRSRSRFTSVGVRILPSCMEAPVIHPSKQQCSNYRRAKRVNCINRAITPAWPESYTRLGTGFPSAGTWRLP